MHILINHEEGIVTFVPVTDKESETVTAVVNRLQPNETLNYGSRDDDPENKDYCTVLLHAGGKRELVTEKVASNVSVTHTQFLGSTELELVGTTVDDKRAVTAIRNTCFFSTGGLIFLGKTVHQGRLAINVTPAQCKHCSANILDRLRAEWNTCSECVGKCDHEYVRGMIHGTKLDMGVGEYCSKCGECRPPEEGEREKSVLEQHLAVESELGVFVLYENGPADTPSEAVQLRRLARRHARANRA